MEIRRLARQALKPLFLGAGLACAMGTAGAAAQGVDPTRTFDGSCDFSGTVAFDPPLSNKQRATHQTATALGRCSGTFTTANGRKHQLDDARILYRAKSSGDVSCASSAATGGGFLEYHGHKLHFRFAEDRVTATGTLRLTGKSGGSFEATLTPNGDPVALTKKCSGDGLRQTKVKFSGSTMPAISG